MSRKNDGVREFCFVATNMTLNFKSSDEVKTILDPHASYQLIPAVTEAVSMDIWQLIIDLLPHSKYNICNLGTLLLI